MHRWLLLWALCAASPARAGVLGNPELGVFSGIELVVARAHRDAAADGLPAPDQRRLTVGIGIHGELEWRDDGRSLQELVGFGADIEWLHPYVGAELHGRAGLSYPSVVADHGYMHAVAVAAGAGLGLSTDGFAGFTTQAEVLGPLISAKLEADRWQGKWHRPRIAAGLLVPHSCCGYNL